MDQIELSEDRDLQQILLIPKLNHRIPKGGKFSDYPSDFYLLKDDCFMAFNNNSNRYRSFQDMKQKYANLGLSMWNIGVTAQIRQNKAAYLMHLSRNSEESLVVYALKQGILKRKVNQQNWERHKACHRNGS